MLNAPLNVNCLPSQLFYDGHQQLAVGLSAIAQPDPPCPPSDRLLHIALLGLQNEPDRSAKQQLSALTGAISTQEAAAGPGLGIYQFIHLLITCLYIRVNTTIAFVLTK